MASNDETRRDGGAVSRRSFLRHVGAAAVVADGLIGATGAEAQTPGAAATPADAPRAVGGEQPITLSINGQTRDVKVEPRTTLLNALRDRLEPAITGPKLVCDQGTCGACTVLVDGKAAYGCSILAIDAVGRQVTTVEGFGTPEKLSPVQAAFCEKDAMMCGFCTSGFVTTVTGLLNANPNATGDEIREGCKGNFCRCGTFPHIFAAAEAAAKAMQAK